MDVITCFKVNYNSCHILDKTIVMNAEQNKEVAAHFQDLYIEVYLLRNEVLTHKFGLQLQPSSPPLDVKVLLQFSCDFSESHRRKTFSELRSESGIFIAPDIGLLQDCGFCCPSALMCLLVP